jgi:ATP-dependent exoDNAse (exonuclease V) alpha subunit
VPPQRAEARCGQRHPRHHHPHQLSNTRTVEAVDDRGVQLTLPADYLDAGHVTHGYAITGHKAQGLTCEHTYTLGTETLYREWGYVAMSRGRLTNQLYHGPVDIGDDGQHAATPPTARHHQQAA